MSEAKERYDRERREARRPRLERVAQRYEAGATYEQMAAEEGVSTSVISSDIQWHRRRGRCLRRNRALDDLLDDARIEEICDLYNVQRLSVEQIGQRFGWSKPDTQTAIEALRRKGVHLPRRHGQPVIVDPSEPRRLKRNFKKRQLADPTLSDKRKAILRILGAAQRPVGAAELHRFLSECGERISKQAVRNRLLSAEKDGLVARARPELRQYFERGAGRWFVPLDAQQSADTLTLADAERETELAALIESQEDELQRGDWVDSEKGHWADKSVDAPLTADGFTILDTLAEQDDVLAEMGQAA